LRAGQRRARRQLGEKLIGKRFERAQELDPHFGKIGAETGYLGFFSQVSFVATVGGSETTHVGTEVRHAPRQIFAAEQNIFPQRSGCFI
jgi:hypothetical protein